MSNQIAWLCVASGAMMRILAPCAAPMPSKISNSELGNSMVVTNGHLIAPSSVGERIIEGSRVGLPSFYIYIFFLKNQSLLF